MMAYEAERHMGAGRGIAGTEEAAAPGCSAVVLLCTCHHDRGANCLPECPPLPN